VNEFREHLKAAVLTPDSQSYWHIGEEQMIAFYEGELTANQREAMQDHLAECIECLNLFRNVSDFFDAPRENEEQMTEAEIADEWYQLWEKVKKDELPAKPGSENPAKILPFVNKPRAMIPAIRLAVAASLLLSIGSAGYLAWQLNQEKREAEAARNEVAKIKQEQQLKASQMDLALRSLSQQNESLLAEQIAIGQRMAELNLATPSTLQNVQPEYFSFGEERDGDGKSLEFASGVQAKLLVMTIKDPTNFQSYIVEMQDGTGRPVQAPAILKPLGDDNTLNLVVNRASLKNGKYRLVLYGLKGGERQKLGEQELTIKLNR
jgi:hypothetical protein